MDRNDALDRLESLCDPDVDPVLTESQKEYLLDLAVGPDADGLLPTEEGWTETYSVIGVYRAVAAGWLLKAGNAAGRFDFTTDGQNFRRSQIVDHCEAQAAFWRRKTNESAPIAGAA